jgi:hypothetical protein
MHPAQEPEQLRLAARCGARTRSGTPCRSPAVTGRSRCRMHGGAPGSGGPKGRRNGNYKHGRYRGDRLSQVGEAAHTRREGTDQETASVPVRGGSGGGEREMTVHATACPKTGGQVPLRSTCYGTRTGGASARNRRHQPAPSCQWLSCDHTPRKRSVRTVLRCRALWDRRAH